MKIYIFNRLEVVSSRYHSKGGAVIVARDEQEAREFVEHSDSLEITDDEWNTVVAYNLSDNVSGEVFIFPDAGCC